MNVLTPDDIQWSFISSLALTDCHICKMVNNEYGLEYESVTKKTSDGESFCKPKHYYFIAGQQKEYTDLQLLCDDWNEIKNFDDPENEIVWVKKIVKKISLTGK